MALRTMRHIFSWQCTEQLLLDEPLDQRFRHQSLIGQSVELCIADLANVMLGVVRALDQLAL